MRVYPNLHKLSCVLCRGSVKPCFDMVQCTKCGLLQLPLDEEGRQKWAQRFYDYCRPYHLRGYKDFKARAQHDYDIAEGRILNMLRFCNLDQKFLLDVGAGTGGFLEMARSFGFDVLGVEPDSWAVQQMQEVFPHVQVINQLFEDAELEGSFDIICFIDTFEHFAYPVEAMTKAVELLASDGLIMLEMPDAGCRAAEKLPTWKHYKPEEHFCLWQLDQVQLLAEKLELELLDSIVPYPERRSYYLCRKGQARRKLELLLDFA